MKRGILELKKDDFELLQQLVSADEGNPLGSKMKALDDEHHRLFLSEAELENILDQLPLPTAEDSAQVVQLRKQLHEFKLKLDS